MYKSVSSSGREIDNLVVKLAFSLFIRGKLPLVLHSQIHSRLGQHLLWVKGINHVPLLLGQRQVVLAW